MSHGYLEPENMHPQCTGRQIKHWGGRQNKLPECSLFTENYKLTAAKAALNEWLGQAGGASQSHIFKQWGAGARRTCPLAITGKAPAAGTFHKFPPKYRWNVSFNIQRNREWMARTWVCQKAYNLNFSGQPCHWYTIFLLSRVILNLPCCKK